MRRSLPMVIAAATLTLAACTGTSAPGAATPSAGDATTAAPPAAPSGPSGPHPADDLRATVVQYTRDRPNHVVQVKVANDGDAALEVTLVDPRLSGYDAATPPAQTSHLAPDRRVDFPVPLGAATCATAPGPTAASDAASAAASDAASAATDGGSSVVVSATAPDGATVRRSVAITDEAGLLPRIHALDCDVARVEDTVEITLGDSWRQVGSGADAAITGTVAMALRPGATTARVTALDAGLLLGVAAGDPQDDRPQAGDSGGAATYTVDARRPRTSWEVELIGTRCDGHAIAESRRLMALTLVVTVPGAEAVPIRRVPDEAGYQTMVTALQERCDARGGSAEE